jgi:predicted ribosome quality control (RQC) complex YloA/Tae2 family protein
MDHQSIKEIVAELEPLLVGRAPGKLFQLNPHAIVVDFGLRDHGFLFIDVEPAQARLYLIKRRVRDLEKRARPLGQFALTMRKDLAGTRLVSLTCDPDDRVIRFRFAGEDELGKPRGLELLAQLTGRSANLLLLDARDEIVQALRSTSSPGQQIGQPYQKPKSVERPAPKKPGDLLALIRNHKFDSPSEAADAHFTSLLAEKQRAAQIASARAEVRKKISQQRKLLKQLESDLQSHADADRHKRIGDLLLANVGTAKRHGNRVTLIDYFSDDASPLVIEVDESLALPKEAARQFAQYSRSKRAVTQINKRLELARKRLRELEAEQETLATEPASVPATRLPEKSASRTAVSATKRVPGTRRYISSDGFEILVGRTAQDNDNLTFKVGRPNDLWLHAADYGGSHVIVRNATRKPVPPRTLIEAAQLAAFFSQAKKDPKVDVHYTERKFVSRIKGAKPGLVRLQRFKTITVAPKESRARE